MPHPARFLSKPFRSYRAVLLGAGVLTLALAVSACSGGDDDDADPTQADAGVATATATTEATSETPPPGGTLTPAETPTQAGPTATGSTGATGSEPQEVVQLADMVPCGEDETYYEEVVLEDGVHVYTYKDVPEGTPIVFPFEDGRVRHVDARAGGINIAYDVEGVGVFSVFAAGSSSLDRNVAHATKGEVIGHFNGEFGELESSTFEGQQLYFVVGTEELVRVGDQLFRGEALDPEITDCLVLP